MTSTLATRIRQTSDSTRVVMALALAVALGIAIAASESPRALSGAAALRPVGTLWVNAIRMTVIPLVVSLLITGISSVADLRSVGRLSSQTLGVFALLLMGCAVTSLIVGQLLFALFPWDASARVPLPPGAAEAARDLATVDVPTGVVDWFTALIPANPIAAAVSGNMVSLIVFVLLLALATAYSPPATRDPLLRFFAALGDVMLLLVRWIIALAPVAVFCLVLPMVAESGASLVGAVGFYIVSIAVTCAVIVLLYYPLVAAFGGVRAGRFARAVLPMQMIGMSSTSSVATLPAMVESARALQLPERISGFVLPLAVSTFKPAASPMWIVGTLFVARVYGVPIGARELGVVAAAAVFLSFAAPGVPRGAWLPLAPLFVAIGLPAEGIGVLIAVDAIPDVCATVVNVTGNLAATALVSRRAGPTGSSSSRASSGGTVPS